MACVTPKSGAVRVDVALKTHGQTREKIRETIEAILNQYPDFIECGLMGGFSLDLGVRSEAKPPHGAHPSDELAKLGVISLKTEHSA